MTDNFESIDFYHACTVGEEENVLKWIEMEGDINRQYQFDQTGLIVAAQRGHMKIVRLLVDHNADVDITDAWGYNAIMKAAACGHTAIFRLLLKKCKTSFYDTFLGKQSPLTEAAVFGRTEIIKLSLEHDASMIDSPVGLSGMTPLMLAVLGGHYDAVEILLENGANVTLKNTSAQTAIEIAWSHGDEDMIKLLKSYSCSAPSMILPEIVVTSEVNHNEVDTDVISKFNLTPTSRLPIRNNERPMRMNSLVRHITRRSKSCENTKRKRNLMSKSEGLFKYILETEDMEKYWPRFKEHQIDLKLFFTLNDDDFKSIGIVDQDEVDNLTDIAYHYKLLFNF